MPSVKVFDREPIDKALRRLKRLTEKCGTMDDYEKHEFFEKPSMLEKRRRASAVKRQERLTRQEKEKAEGKVPAVKKNPEKFKKVWDNE